MSRASDLSRRAVLAAGAVLLVRPAFAAAGAGRVVVLGGDLAEIAFALGAGDRLVGADDTSLWPPEAAAVPKVGYLRRLSAEGILSLFPDLVLASADAGPPTVMDQLRAAGLTVATAPAGTGFDSVIPKVRFVGDALGLAPEARALADRIESDMARVEAAVAGLSDMPSVVFLISVGRGAPMASGEGTAADAMIRLAHARNAVEGFEGYKPLSAESAVGLVPDAILLPDHVVAAAGSAEQAVALAGLSDTRAGREGRIVVMDGLKLLGFGPRTPEAVAELTRALHPAATIEF